MNPNSRPFLWLVLFTLLLLSGCGATHGPYYIAPNPFSTVRTIALLPMYNMTNDVGGAEMVRKQAYKEFVYRHYSVLPIEESDRLLREKMGITLGGQLEYTNPEAVAEALGVDGLVYGYLLNFDDIITGVYNVKEVRAGFKLVHGASGSVIWARGGGVKSFYVGGKAGTAVTILKEIGSGSEVPDLVKGLEEVPGLEEWHIIRVIPLEKLEHAAVISLGEEIVTTMFKTHLKLETNSLLRIILEALPAGPGELAPASG
ncbi:MAG: hypothetical protein ACE5EZ_00200 [Thermodesulfobacteriota bacterium]